MQTQELHISQILPEVLGLGMPIDVSVIFCSSAFACPKFLSQDIFQRKRLKKRAQVASGLLNTINPTLTLTQKLCGFNYSCDQCHNLKSLISRSYKDATQHSSQPHHSLIFPHISTRPIFTGHSGLSQHSSLPFSCLHP